MALLTSALFLMLTLEPDIDVHEAPPSLFHGQWRVLAADDPDRQAVMRIDIQHGRGEREGSGSYMLFQPFCDLVDGRKITGTATCELTDESGDMSVRADASRLVATLRPTTDEAEHRLVLRRRGKLLFGTYQSPEHRRAVQFERVPQ